jgi:hypothetical protein
MKLTTVLSTFLAVSPALGCLETFGLITPADTFAFALSIDNDVVTCNSNWGWRIDQDGHFSLSCVDGYVYAFTLDGGLAWYSNGVESWQIQQPIQATGTGAWWAQKQFGC